jgi:tetratricopeptide (TPR) repeat protein
MESSQILHRECMKRFLFLILVLFTESELYTQPNCNIYKWKGDTLCYLACIESENADSFAQGSRNSQDRFNKSIQLCPSFAYSYFEKSVPYLKRGDFISWKLLIDKAVLLSPKEYLGYRGWCRFQFIRDYKGAIQDIDSLSKVTTYDIGYSINGDYHLSIARALCYKGLGDFKKAIGLIESQLKSKNYSAGFYDYLHLGVLKLQTGDYKGAIKALKKELKIYNYMAETYYYLAVAHKKIGNKKEFKKNIILAKSYYLEGKKRTDPYTEPFDKIYLGDIELEITRE